MPRYAPVAAAENRTVDGIVFDSAMEARRYFELRCLARAVPPVIRELRRQLPFALPGGIRYTPDFCYYDIEAGVSVAEEVKPLFARKDAAYRIRVRLFVAEYPEWEHREWSNE